MIPNFKTQPEFFDIHSHLNFSQFDEDRQEIIEQMHEEKIWTITVGTGLKTSRESIELAEKNDGFFATVGVHPTEVGGGSDLSVAEAFDESSFEEIVSNGNVVGVGETGLDYFRLDEDDRESKKKQKELFIKQIEFAGKHKKPLMIHGRPSAGTQDAYLDMVEILNSYFVTPASEFSGNIHFFVGDQEIARKFLDMGFTISFDGPITFTSEYNDAVDFVPLEKIMAETDAPFAAPEPYRGKRNNPLYVPEIVKAIAEIKGKDFEDVRKILTQNALSYWSV